MKKVLICEDDSSIGRLIQTNLHSSGHQTVLLAHEPHPLSRIRDEAPGVIVMDVMLEMVDGFDLLQRLKSDPATAHLPIIVVSARVEDDAMQRGYDLGAFVYLPKPFEPYELAHYVSLA